MGDLVSSLLHQWPWLSAMGVLILLSAFFSGGEAALFSLSDKDRRKINAAGGRGKRVNELLRDSERLLSAILFCNLLTNMTYFAIASIVGAELESDPAIGRTVVAGFTITSLLIVIFFSEMLPKSIAVLSPVRGSMIVAAPLGIVVRIVSPILPVVKAANRAAHRLIWPTFRPEPDLDLADIERAIELGTDDAALRQRERAALRALVAMAETRADELMRPRGRLPLVTPSVGPDVLNEGSPPGGYLFVISEMDETIVGAIHVRLLRPSQIEDLQEAIDPVIYVPWSAHVSQVYQSLMSTDRRIAVVVNEFGDSLGAISVEDILRSVLAPEEPRDGDGEGAIVVTAEGQLRVSGVISLRALTKHLGIDSPDERTATVAGYIQRANERLPRVGDQAVLDAYEMTVIEDDEDGVWIDVRKTRRPETDPPEATP